MIKFRVWHKENKQYMGKILIDHLFLNMAGRVLLRVNQGSRGSRESFEDITDKVDIEFCTGKKAINKEDVYEGDIEKSRINGDCHLIKRLYDGNPLYPSSTIEIIGNIKESPNWQE